MIKELRVDYRKCFTNSALSSTAKRFSPSTLQAYRTGLFEGEFDSISPLTPIRQIRGPLNPAGQATRKGLAMRGLYRTEEMIQSSITMAQPAIINRERSYFIYLQKFAAIAKFCFFLSDAKKFPGGSVMPCALRFYCIYRAKTRPARP